MRIYYKKKHFTVDVKKVSLFERFSGLMFKNSMTDNLLFEFKKDNDLSIHSLFVFFPFLALWIGDKNKVIDFRIVESFSLSVTPKRKFRKLVELPMNKKNKKIFDFFVGKGKV